MLLWQAMALKSAAVLLHCWLQACCWDQQCSPRPLNIPASYHMALLLIHLQQQQQWSQQQRGVIASGVACALYSMIAARPQGQGPHASTLLPTFQSLIVLSFVAMMCFVLFELQTHRTLLIFSSISKLFR